jgi:hypothetical protein
MTESDSPTKPSGTCILCPPPREGGSWRLADSGYTTCHPCYRRVHEALIEVADRYAMLDATPGASGDGGRGAPGFGSRSPASDHVIAMTDRRSSSVARVWVAADGRVHREPERPPVSIWGALDGAAWAIAEEHHLDGPPAAAGVYELTRWIDNRLDYVTRGPLVADLWADLRTLLGHLRPVTGDARFRIGTCPNTIDTGEHTIECGAPLHAPATGDTIYCPNRACSRAWSRAEWVELGRLLQSETAA